MINQLLILTVLQYRNLKRITWSARPQPSFVSCLEWSRSSFGGGIVIIVDVQQKWHVFKIRLQYIDSYKVNEDNQKISTKWLNLKLSLGDDREERGGISAMTGVYMSTPSLCAHSTLVPWKCSQYLGKPRVHLASSSWAPAWRRGRQNLGTGTETSSSESPRQVSELSFATN